jgi:hypothetical protein
MIGYQTGLDILYGTGQSSLDGEPKANSNPSIHSYCRSEFSPNTISVGSENGERNILTCDGQACVIVV